MAPQLLDTTSDDPRDAIHRAVESLAAGNLVVLPTETVYGLAATALEAEAVESLTAAKQRPVDQPLALAVASAEAAWDFVPEPSPLARRLARRGWPGPLTLVLPVDHPDSALHQLPENVRPVVAPSDRIGFRVPQNDVTRSVLQLSAGPLVLSSANPHGKPPATEADQSLELGDVVDLVLDDGPTRYEDASSVVLVENNSYKILREGVLTAEHLEKMSSAMILTVCTGNTCRSPMAEILLKKQLADYLDCPFDELDQEGIMVMSAGVSAMGGSRASQEAEQVLAQRQLDLASHLSRQVDEQLIRFADQIWTMTRAHRDVIVQQWPHVAERVHVLDPNGRDVADPIGGSIDLYEECANQINSFLEARLSAMDLDAFRPASGNAGETG